MDPISALGLAGTLLKISGGVVSALQNLVKLQSKYRSSSLVVSLLIGQLTTLKAALNQITEWAGGSLVGIDLHEQFVTDVQVSLESCHILILVLEQKIEKLGQEQDDGRGLSIKGKVGFLFGEEGLNEFTNHLNNQVNALNLLLTAFHCRTRFERNELLCNNESRETIKQVEDDRTSLLSFRDTTSQHTKISTASENWSLLDREFDFDEDVITTSVYRTALRSTMSKANTPDIFPTKKNPDLVVENDRATNSLFMTDPVLNQGGVEITISKSMIPITNDIVSQIISEPVKEDSKSGQNSKSSSYSTNETTALLLGSSSSGKINLLNSLVYILGNWDRLDRIKFIRAIFSDVVYNMRVILEAMKSGGISLGEEKNEYHAGTILIQPKEIESDLLPRMVYPAIVDLWRNSGVRNAFGRLKEPQLSEHAAYFFDNIHRIADPEYIPNDEDISKTRGDMTRSIEKVLKLDGKEVRFINLGTKYQTMNFLRVHSTVEAIIFVVDITAWSSNNHVTRDGLSKDDILFNSMISSHLFLQTRFILAFVNTDKLEEKLRDFRFKKIHPWFQGDEKSVQDVKDYFLDHYKRMARGVSKGDLYAFFPSLNKNKHCDSMEVIFEAVMTA